jgi:hypothetical protein
MDIVRIISGLGLLGFSFSIVVFVLTLKKPRKMVAEELSYQASRFDFLSECLGECASATQLRTCANMLRQRAEHIKKGG